MGRAIVLAALFLLTACDKDAQTKVYHKEIIQTDIPCMKLQVLPLDSEISNTLKKLYTFKKECPLTFAVSYKYGIKCNSSYNVQSKSLGHFPSSYLKIELREGLNTQYSYYIDLEHKADKSDVENAWERINEDLKIRQ